MKKPIKGFLTRLLSIRNIVPLLVVVMAFIGTFLQTPFGLQRDQIVLALLAFLAIDSLVERLEMLYNMENDIRKVKDLAESRFPGKSMLRHREDFPRIDRTISDAKEEIWISGITLDVMATLTGLFQQKAENGVRVRFLGVNPDSDLMEGIANYFGFEDEIATRIRANLNTLYSRVVRNFAQDVELRTTPHRLATGYFIVDPHSEQGHMTVTPYFYQTPDSHWSPVLLLTKRADSHWFTLYLNDFNRLWDNAIEWTPDQ